MCVGRPRSSLLYFRGGGYSIWQVPWQRRHTSWDPPDHCFIQDIQRMLLCQIYGTNRNQQEEVVPLSTPMPYKALKVIISSWNYIWKPMHSYSNSVRYVYCGTPKTAGTAAFWTNCNFQMLFKCSPLLQWSNLKVTKTWQLHKMYLK